MDFTKYASAHKEQNGPGDQRTTALQIIDDENLHGAWTDKVVLATGSSSGIGIATIEALLATGAKVYAAARNLSKARDALSHLPQQNLHYLEIDLGSLASVRAAAAAFLSKESKLNVLLNNAGIMALPDLQLTKDGFESQFATNHLGHFLLFQLLKPALVAGSTPTFRSRVVNVSSLAHRLGEPDFGDLELKAAGAYEPWKAYGVSKTALIWTANEIDRRHGGVIHGYSLHPGGIRTGLQVHTREFVDRINEDPKMAKRMKSTEQGAATSVWAATASVWEGQGGKYLEDCQVSQPFPADAVAFTATPGYAAWIYDEEKAQKLWEASNAMVGFEE